MLSSIDRRSSSHSSSCSLQNQPQEIRTRSSLKYLSNTHLTLPRSYSKVMPLIDVTVDIENEPKHYMQGDIVKGVAHFAASPSSAGTKSKKNEVIAVEFDELRIDLEGISKNSWIQPGAGHHIADTRVEGTHVFLRIEGPELARHYPADRTLRKGQSLDFPFQFRIPNELPDTACRPDISSDKLRHLHLQLPPTFGDPKAAGIGHFLNNLPDMASPFSWIHYRVQAQVLKSNPGGLPEQLGRARREVRFLPAVAEHAPLHVGEEDEEYRLRHEMKLARLMQKKGRIVVEAVQPKPWTLPAPNAQLHPDHRITTTVELMLRFDPKNSSIQPPELDRLKAKVRVVSFVSAGARKDFPSLKKAQADPFKLSIWDENIELADRQIKNVCWLKHEPGASDDNVLSRHASISAASPSWYPKPTAKADPKHPFYTARIVVPLALPTNKVWVPTFHSSMTSRLYVAQLKITIPWNIAAQLHLKVPVELIAAQTEDQPQLDLAADDPLAEWLQAQVVADVPARVDGIDRAAYAANTTLPPYSPRESAPQPMLPPQSPHASSQAEENQVQQRDRLLREELGDRSGGGRVEAPPDYQGFGPVPAYATAH